MPTENKPEQVEKPAAKRTSRPAAKKHSKPLIERVGEVLLAHPVATGLLSCLFVAGVAVAIFWFTIFSGLDASADFVYSQF